MASTVFTEEQQKVIQQHPLSKIISRDQLPKNDFDHYISSAISDDGMYFKYKYLALLTETDVLFNFSRFLCNLVCSFPAKSITVVNSNESLAHRLIKFYGHWCSQASFNPNLRPYCSTLLEK